MAEWRVNPIVGSSVIVSVAGSYAPASDSPPRSPFLRVTLPTLVLVLRRIFSIFWRIPLTVGSVSVAARPVINSWN